MWDEFNLFYHVPGYNITINKRINSKAHYICPFNIEMIKRIKENISILFDFIWCDILVKLIDNKIFYKNAKKYLFVNENKENRYNIFLIYYQIYTKLLITNRYISQKVYTFLNKHSKKYIALQIRVGNEDLKESLQFDSYDMDLMIRLAKKSIKYNKWFLTGDSQRLKQNLSKKFIQIFLYTRNITKHYNNNRKDFNIIIEHEILSKASLFIISKSTYGLTAVLKSGLLLKSNKELCYEIKRSHINNIYNHFDKFHCVKDNC